MWTEFVRQFRIVLPVMFMVVSLHGLPQNRLVINGLRQLSSVGRAERARDSFVKVVNPLISPVKTKQNLNNVSSSTGKPAVMTVSTFSNLDIRSTLFQSSITMPDPEQILKDAYNKAVVFPTAPTPRTKKPESTINIRNPLPTAGTIITSKLPSANKPVVKPCQKVIAGTLCEDDADYPTDTARMLSKTEKFKYVYSPYFGNDTSMYKTDVIHTRFDSNANDGTPLCATKDDLHIYTPTKLKNKHNQWKYILQHGTDNLTQVIQVEICANTNSQCDLIPSFATGYRSKCVQKYSYRKLVWFEQSNNADGIDEFQIPSCCSCRYFPDDEAQLKGFPASSKKAGG